MGEKIRLVRKWEKRRGGKFSSERGEKGREKGGKEGDFVPCP